MNVSQDTLNLVLTVFVSAFTVYLILFIWKVFIGNKW